MDSKGQVLTVWLTPDDLWMLDAIERFRERMEAKGVEIKKNEILRRALTAQLEPFRETADC
jgi:hypothetical protein